MTGGPKDPRPPPRVSILTRPFGPFRDRAASARTPIDPLSDRALQYYRSRAGSRRQTLAPLPERVLEIGTQRIFGARRRPDEAARKRCSSVHDRMKCAG